MCLFRVFVCHLTIISLTCNLFFRCICNNFIKSSIKNFKWKEVLWPEVFGKDRCSYFNNFFFVICARNIIGRQYLREAEIVTLNIIAQKNMWHIILYTIMFCDKSDSLYAHGITVYECYVQLKYRFKLMC
jgi:hypothetical protein